MRASILIYIQFLFSLTAKMVKAPTRKCEVLFAYSAVHEDELELLIGETVEILREVKQSGFKVLH